MATPNTIHWGYYDASLKPVLKVDSGDIIDVSTVSGDPAAFKNLGVDPTDIPSELIQIHTQVKDKGPGPHILTGPILVEGAQPRDVLEIEILNVSPMVNYGHNNFCPSYGTLPEDYPYQRSKLLKLNLEKNTAQFSDNIELSLNPFFGQLGVAPPQIIKRLDSTSPGFHGGNLDNKELIAGSKVFLPVHVPGALFSVGDGHAIQGDGEASISALETCLNGKLKLTVRKDLRLLWPMAETYNHIISMGFHENLFEASKMAIRNMILYMIQSLGLDQDDAYSLISLSVDLHVTQLVNGVKGIHGLLPKAILNH